VVAVLGDIDQNFGAGMTGGLCYVWDAKSRVRENLNHDFVEAIYLDETGDTYQAHADYIQELIQKHYRETHSSKAAQFLADFDSNARDLVLIKPKGISMANLLNYLYK
jgi:glutamate synthase (NADPH/NADH) large chain